MVVVLFFQTWNTLRLPFKRKSFQWLLTSAGIVITLSVGLSKINFIDYKAFNQHYLSKNIYHQYMLELPETDFYDRVIQRSLVDNIYLVENKTQHSSG